MANYSNNGGWERRFNKLQIAVNYLLANQGTSPRNYTEIERDALTDHPEGLIIFNTTSAKLNYYTNGEWEEIAIN